MTPSKSKIVFLGGNLNPISMGCLRALVATDRYELRVGIDESERSAWQTLRIAHRRYGLSGASSRVIRLFQHRASTLLRPSITDIQRARCLREIAQLADLECSPCSRVNASAFRQDLSHFQPDLIVVANFSQIIDRRVQGIPKFGVLNVHPSMLPRYRGPTPVYWVLKNGETRTGVTVHFIDEGVDTGPIIMQQEIPVRANDNEKRLTMRCVEVGAALLVSAVDAVLAGVAKPIEQDESKASYFGFPRSAQTQRQYA